MGLLVLRAGLARSGTPGRCRGRRLVVEVHKELLTGVRGEERQPGELRRGSRSRVSELIPLMFANPFLTVRRVERALGVTNQGARNLIRDAEERGKRTRDHCGSQLLDGSRHPPPAGCHSCAMAPRTLMFLRHAEKPADSGPPLGVDQHGQGDPHSLSAKGWTRAGGPCEPPWPPGSQAASASPIVVTRSRNVAV